MRQVKKFSDILRSVGVVLLLLGLVLTIYATATGGAAWKTFSTGLSASGMKPNLVERIRFNDAYFSAMAGARQDMEELASVRTANAISCFEGFSKRAAAAEQKLDAQNAQELETYFDTELDIEPLVARFEQRDSLEELTEIREIFEYLDMLGMPALKSGKVLPKLKPASTRPWFEQRHAQWLAEHGEEATGSFLSFLHTFERLIRDQGDVKDARTFAEAITFEEYQKELEITLAQEREVAASFLDAFMDMVEAKQEGTPLQLSAFLRTQYEGIGAHFADGKTPPYGVFLAAVRGAFDDPAYDGSYSALVNRMRTLQPVQSGTQFDSFMRGFGRDLTADSDSRKDVPMSVPIWWLAAKTLWFWVAGVALIILSYVLARVATTAILKRREYKGVQDDPDVLLRVHNLRQYFKSGDYVNKAVDGVSFYIKKGEVFGLVGESGCGKTTTGRTIINLYDPTDGDVYFQGLRISSTKNGAPVMLYQMRKELEQKIAALKARYSEQKKQQPDNASALEEACNKEIADLRQQHEQDVERVHAHAFESEEEKRKCVMLYREQRKAELTQAYEADKAQLTGEALAERTRRYQVEMAVAARDNIMTKMQMIFQDPIASINPRMTVREIIAEGLHIRGVKDKDLINEKVYEMLDLVGLVPEHADRYPHEFSGGQRQRIGIARAIVLEPDLIIADEPISALDVSIQAQIINLLNDLRKRMGLTIMFIAHNLSVVKYFSDRIAVMYFGHIVEMAPSEELFRHPLHPYTKSLLSAIPYPDPHYEKQRKRIEYEPVLAHDYSVDKPEMHEIIPGHFVRANQAELAKYRKELGL